MPGFKGSDFQYNASGCPHKTKIARKPEGVGAELKVLADGESGIMLRLDVMEGSVANACKMFSEFGEGTAVTLRLTEPYWTSGRTVIADSAFGSVKCAKQLSDRGMFFMGMVKTAQKQYPAAYLKAWSNGSLPDSTGALPDRGSHILFSSQMPGENRPVYAMCWADRRAKCIVATRGSTSDGPPSVRPRSKRVKKDGLFETVSYSKSVRRPRMIEQFFRHFGAVDVHDHLRQGSVGMEREWLTHTWWHRLFATIMSVCVVDAFLGHRYESQLASRVPTDLNTFIGKLAFQLIHNTISDQGMSRRSMSESSIAPVPVIQISRIFDITC